MSLGVLLFGAAGRGSENQKAYTIRWYLIEPVVRVLLLGCEYRNGKRRRPSPRTRQTGAPRGPRRWAAADGRSRLAASSRRRWPGGRGRGRRLGNLGPRAAAHCPGFASP